MPTAWWDTVVGQRRSCAKWGRAGRSRGSLPLPLAWSFLSKKTARRRSPSRSMSINTPVLRTVDLTCL